MENWTILIMIRLPIHWFAINWSERGTLSKQDGRFLVYERKGKIIPCLALIKLFCIDCVDLESDFRMNYKPKRPNPNTEFERSHTSSKLLTHGCIFTVCSCLQNIRPANVTTLKWYPIKRCCTCHKYILTGSYQWDIFIRYLEWFFLWDRPPRSYKYNFSNSFHILRVLELCKFKSWRQSHCGICFTGEFTFWELNSIVKAYNTFKFNCQGTFCISHIMENSASIRKRW